MNTSSRVTAELDDAGVHLSEMLDETLDVELDGRRLWSLKPERDGEQHADGAVMVPWPGQLHARLNGTGRLTLRVHGETETLVDEVMRLGGSDEPLVIEDEQGFPLTMMKTGRLTRSYGEDAGELVEKVVEAALAAEALVARETDLTVFLSYGGLLGAVRESKIIGHDNDLDLLVMYPETTPVDVIRRSYQLERIFRREGWYTFRYSAATFKVARDENHGAAELIDMFAGFRVDGQTYFMPNLSAGHEGLQVDPVTTVSLEGREFRAPHDTTGWLELIYGPTWRKPDPGWKFEPTPAVRRRISGWTRSATLHRADWNNHFGKQPKPDFTRDDHTDFASWVAERAEPGHLTDVGCGSGRDAVWFAEQGFEVIATDLTAKAIRWTRTRSARRGVDVDVRRVNMLEAHRVLALGGELAFGEGPHHVYARLTLEALNPLARANFWRLASMATRSGGKVFLEFRTPPGRGRTGRRAGKGPSWLYRSSAADVQAQVEAAGGRVEHCETGRGLAVDESTGEDPQVCRMVASWS